MTPLASDMAGVGAMGQNLQNAWGLVRSPTSPWWIADNGTAKTSVYNGSGGLISIGGLDVQGVPGPRLYATDFANGRVDVFDGS
jgi:hypothetical protein